MPTERRHHRRLEMRLPVTYRLESSPREYAQRTVTNDVSTGGLHFRADFPDGTTVPQAQDLLDIELTVPPGDGYSPYEGRLNTTARVVRCEPVLSAKGVQINGDRQFDIAVQFTDPLRLQF